MLYNHGFVSFASENTSLMEELASHGYLVIAVRHVAQFEEIKGLQRGRPASNRPALRDLEQQILRSDARGRSELARAYYEASTTTNRIVRERAADSSFVLDHLPAVLAAIPGQRADADRVAAAHLVGYSAGGAVSTQVASRDSRALSVTNLDGGTQGPVDARDLRIPYLMCYSAKNEGINDLLLPDHARRVTAPETAHLNFHDIAGLIPLLRFSGALGRTNARAFLQQRNAITRDFLGTAGQASRSRIPG